MTYIIKQSAVMRSDFNLAMHAYISEQNVTLAKYYRDLVNMVHEIITKSYMCIKH